MADLGAPQLRLAVVGRLERADLLELERAHDAVTVGGVDRGGGPRRALGEQRVQRVRAAAFELGIPALARAGLRRRTQRERRERSAQIQTGATDHDRRGALGQQLVDLGMSERRVLPDAETRVHRQKRHQAVFQHALLGLRRHPREQFEPGVDLQRVGRNRDRAAAPLAQPPREGERNVGLADPGRPEQRDHRLGHGLSIVASWRFASASASHAQRDARVGAIEASRAAAEGLAGERADIAVVFACGAHLAAPEAVLEGVHEALRPAQLVGCGASGVLAAGAEVEEGTAIAVWAAALADGAVHDIPRQRAADRRRAIATPPRRPAEPTFSRSSAGASGAIVFPDPYTFDTEALLGTLRAHAPGAPRPGRPGQRPYLRRHGRVVSRRARTRGGRRRVGL